MHIVYICIYNIHTFILECRNDLNRGHRDLSYRQKRPISWEKRPTNVLAYLSVAMTSITCWYEPMSAAHWNSGRRNPEACIRVSKETYPYGKRDLYPGKRDLLMHWHT